VRLLFIRSIKEETFTLDGYSSYKKNGRWGIEFVPGTRKRQNSLLREISWRAGAIVLGRSIWQLLVLSYPYIYVCFPVLIDGVKRLLP
jgi:hypothetical protein